MSEAIAQKLDEARALIEKGWCQGRDAMDADGREVDPYVDEAACYCINGAIWRACAGEGEPFLERVLCLNPDASCDITPLIDWNDKRGRTQAEVIEAFKKAAELARGEA